MKRRLLISILIITMSLAAITGGTLAWFTDSAEFADNTFTAGTLEIEGTERLSWAEDPTQEYDSVTATFPEKKNWNPGDCEWKQFKITNVGSKGTYIRLSFDDGWYENTGTTETPFWSDWAPVNEAGEPVDPVEKTVPDWTKIPDNEGVEWYYFELEANPILTPLSYLEVKIDICLDGVTADNNFQGKQYRLSTEFQAIQTSHSAAFENWGVGYVTNVGWRAVTNVDVPEDYDWMTVDGDYVWVKTDNGAGTWTAAPAPEG